MKKNNFLDFNIINYKLLREEIKVFFLKFRIMVYFSSIFTLEITTLSIMKSIFRIDFTLVIYLYYII